VWAEAHRHRHPARLRELGGRNPELVGTRGGNEWGAGA
jgi:hypothetical protein